MKIDIGIAAAAMLYFAGQVAFPTHGTMAAPNAYWLALALAMSATAGGIYLRAKFRDDLVQFRRSTPAIRALLDHRLGALVARHEADLAVDTQLHQPEVREVVSAYSDMLA